MHFLTILKNYYERSKVQPEAYKKNVFTKVSCTVFIFVLIFSSLKKLDRSNNTFYFERNGWWFDWKPSIIRRNRKNILLYASRIKKQRVSLKLDVFVYLDYVINLHIYFFYYQYNKNKLDYFKMKNSDISSVFNNFN